MRKPGETDAIFPPHAGVIIHVRVPQKMWGRPMRLFSVLMLMSYVGVAALAAGI